MRHRVKGCEMYINAQALGHTGNELLLYSLRVFRPPNQWVMNAAEDMDVNG